MVRSRRLTFALLFVTITLVSLTGCTGLKSKSPTATSEPTLTLTPTITLTPTPTQTTTPANTITPRPSFTPTVTLTPYNTLSPTPTASPVPSRPAVLFPYQDINGKTVDWSYIHVTQIGTNRLDEVNDLWAFMSFQLLDRAIYRRNLDFLGETLTVYYLNVAHEFDGEMVTMQLVLGGTPGKNIAIEDIPAGGTAYLQMQVREAWESFAPYVTHRDANRAFEYRDESYPLVFLKDLQALLPTLPDEIILLADHPILFPQDDWPQIKLDMQQASYLAARYQPFFEMDDYDRLVDQSDFAYALRDHILNGWEMPDGLFAYSSQTLILIVNGE
ncbi:MAG: hypothetical protein H0S79_05895 [Anaerolineaceae bacterium]|nr:hypothetical protein [Anaerolineaceae bacterium]